MRELRELLAEMTGLFEQYLPLEQKKLEAAKENNVVFIENSMAQEQALILKLKGLEKRRLKLMEQYGAAGKTLRELLADMTPAERETTQPEFERFARSVKQFRSVNDEAVKLIRLHLYDIENAARRSAGRYTGDGKIESPGLHITDRTV